MSTRAQILRRFDAFLERTGMSHWQFGREAVHDHTFVARLRSGKGVQLTTIEAAEAWMVTYETQRESSDMTGG